MPRPLVSVILIYFNAERYLGEAIQSVTAQTCQDWELLLVDDGSIDGSREIANRYAERDPARVRCLQHPGGTNRGMSASRNLGAQGSKGDFLAFIDADDVWLPAKLECQLGHARMHASAGMICGPTLWWHSWSRLASDLARDRPRELRIEGDRLYDPPELLRRLLRQEARTPATCSVLLRRQAFDAVGGFETQFRGMFEDQVFFSKIYGHVPVYVSSDCLDYYRQHDQSHCSIADRDGPPHFAEENEARRRFISWLQGYVANDEDLRQLLTRSTISSTAPPNASRPPLPTDPPDG